MFGIYILFKWRSMKNEYFFNLIYIIVVFQQNHWIIVNRVYFHFTKTKKTIEINFPKRSTNGSTRISTAQIKGMRTRNNGSSAPAPAGHWSPWLTQYEIRDWFALCHIVLWTIYSFIRFVGWFMAEQSRTFWELEGKCAYEALDWRWSMDLFNTTGTAYVLPALEY